MSYEKKYKGALERAKSAIKECGDNKGRITMIEEIFPEFKESEDERIRKEIIDYIKTRTYHNDWIAWLEKQGEKKYSWDENEKAYLEFTQAAIEYCYDENNPLRKELVAWLNSLKEKVQPKQGKSTLETVKDEKVDNANEVKPKFHEGEWITDGEKVWKIGYIEDDMYIEHRGTISGGGDIKSIDKRYHLWTIQDAKAGDVLCDYNNIYDHPLIFILKKFECVDFGRVRPSDYSSYCFITTGYRQIFKEGMYHHKTNIKPATKEQRTLLFEKMHEAGYEWDEKKLELKKIANDNTEQDKSPLIWHDAAKELPPKRSGFGVSEYVLVHDKFGTVYKSAYDYGNKCWMYNNYNVTHWAYLPEPPKNRINYE